MRVPSCLAQQTLRRGAVTLLLSAMPVSACHRESILARQGDLVVTGAYAHPSAGDAGAAYLRLRNEGSKPDTLLGVRAPEPAIGMMMSTTAGRMEMLPPVVIGPGEGVVMQPGGVHIMLSGLTTEYGIGDTLRLTLTFSRAGDIPIGAPVVPFGEMPE